MTDERRPSLTQVAVQVAAIFTVAAIFLVAWHLVVHLFDLPKLLLPTPLEVVTAGRDQVVPLLQGFMITGASALAGLGLSVVIGAVVAVLFSQSAMLRTACFPYVIFLQTVPIVAIAPLLIIWFGNGMTTVILVACIISLFPVISNTTAGLLAVDADLLDLFRLLHAGRLTVLWKLRIPTAIPYLLLGIRISSGLSVIGAIVGEFFVGGGSGYYGLGALMVRWQQLTQTDALLAALVVSTLLGLLLFGGVALLSPLVLSRLSARVPQES